MTLEIDWYVPKPRNNRFLNDLYSNVVKWLHLFSLGEIKNTRGLSLK